MRLDSTIPLLQDSCVYKATLFIPLNVQYKHMTGKWLAWNALILSDILLTGDGWIERYCISFGH